MPDAAPADCDLVFHASATAAGLTTALNIAGDEATIVELSWYGAGHRCRCRSAAPSTAAACKLVSSQVGKVAPSHRADWTHAQRLEAAIKLTADPQLDALLAPAVAFRDLPARLADILKPRSGVLCQLITYSLRGCLCSPSKSATTS